VDALHDLLLETVIEVVMHLLRQLLVAQGAEVEFLFIRH